MKIIVDAMGGDNAPSAPVMGAIQAYQENQTKSVLVGQRDAILDVLKKNGLETLPDGIEIAQASEIVETCDNPATAFRDKKDSSLTVGLTMLKEGSGDAYVSAGSTGALLAAATLIVKRIRGIRRAALAPVIPTGRGGSVLIDCGANVKCPPEYLLQFAFMGSYYAKHILGRPEPLVGLLNNGSEPSKGTDLQIETYPLLQAADQQGRIRFVGNVEAQEAMKGAVDVIVADGYTGNIFLKTMEGTALFLAHELKKIFTKHLTSQSSGSMAGLNEFQKLINSGEIGGTALLGISKPVIKAHGASDPYAMRNAIKQAVQCCTSDLMTQIADHVNEIQIE